MSRLRVLTEAGLVRYTNGLNQFFSSKKETDAIKADVETLKTSKVDKVEGKDLVSTSDITQITTNKNDIASLKTGKADSATVTELSSTVSSLSTTVSSLESSKANASDVSSLSGKVSALETKLGSAISVGTSAPGSPAQNAVWFDTSNKLVKVYDGSSWLTFGAVYQ